MLRAMDSPQQAWIAWLPWLAGCIRTSELPTEAEKLDLLGRASSQRGMLRGSTMAERSVWHGNLQKHDARLTQLLPVASLVKEEARDIRDRVAQIESLEECACSAQG